MSDRQTAVERRPREKTVQGELSSRVHISVMMDRNQLAALDQIVKGKGRSRSDIIAEAVQLWLQKR